MLVAAGTNIDSVKSNLLVHWVERMQILPELCKLTKCDILPLDLQHSKLTLEDSACPFSCCGHIFKKNVDIQTYDKITLLGMLRGGGVCMTFRDSFCL